MLRLAFVIFALSALAYTVGVYKFQGRTLLSRAEEAYHSALQPAKKQPKRPAPRAPIERSAERAAKKPALNPAQFERQTPRKSVADGNPQRTVIDARPSAGRARPTPPEDQLTPADRDALDDLVAKKLAPK